MSSVLVKYSRYRANRVYPSPNEVENLMKWLTTREDYQFGSPKSEEISD